MTTTFVYGLLAGYGIAIPVGAIAVLIMDTAMRRGFRSGAAAGAGAATADLLYALLAAGAGGLLLPFIAPHSEAFRIASGLLLLAIAVKGLSSLRSRSSARPADRSEEGRTFLRFLLLTVVNPLTVVYFAALVLGRSVAMESAVHLLVFASGAFLASLSWQTLLAGVGSAVGARLNDRARLATGAIGNLLVLAFGLSALTSLWS